MLGPTQMSLTNIRFSVTAWPFWESLSEGGRAMWLSGRRRDGARMMRDGSRRKAALCALALRLTDRGALRLVAWTMLVSHLSAALADALALAQGLAPVAIGANLAIRLLMAALFWWLGLRRA